MKTVCWKVPDFLFVLSFFIIYSLFLPEEFISWLWLDNTKILGALIRTQDMTAGSHLIKLKRKDTYSIPQCVLVFLILWKILLPCPVVLFWTERARSGSLSFQTVEQFILCGPHPQTPAVPWYPLTEPSLWDGQCSHAATPPCCHLISQLLDAVGAWDRRGNHSLSGWVQSEWPNAWERFNLPLTDVNYLTFYARCCRLQNIGYWYYSQGIAQHLSLEVTMVFLQKREDEPLSGDDDNSKRSLRNEARLKLHCYFLGSWNEMIFFYHAKNKTIKIETRRCSWSLHFSSKIVSYLILLL